MKTTPNWVSRVSSVNSTAVKLLACVGLLTSVAAYGGTTITWTGADVNSPVELGDATNWSGNVLPSTINGDVAQWDGSVSGALSLTYTTGLSGGPGDVGINLSLTAAQINNLTIDSSSTTSLRVNNITNNSSLAALTLGGPVGSFGFLINLGGTGGQTSTWINNSSAAATVNKDVEINMGGGGVHTLVLGGTGDWAFDAFLANANTGANMNVVKNNTGILMINNTGAALGLGPVGNTTVNTGTLQVGNATPFMGGSVPAYSIDGLQYGGVTVNTNGILDLNGFSISVDGLNGSLGTIESSVAGAVTLTAGANAGGGTFSGAITNGAGTVTLVAAGTNLFTLSGTNTYTGGTLVTNSATLMVNGTIAGNVTVASGASFGGTGIIPGNVNLSASGSTLTLLPNQPLTLAGNVTLNNNGVIVNVPGVSPLPGGIYTLATYTPANVTGTLNSTPVAFTGAGVVAGTYSISMSSGTVTLTVISTVTSAGWTNSVSGNWSTGANWSSNPNVPHIAGDTAVLGAGTNNITVTLDAAETAGSLNFTNTGSFTIADAGHLLTLDNSGSGATLNVTHGASNVIAAPVFLNDNATITITPSLGNVLSFSNLISSASGKTLTIANGGTLGLYANNTYGPSAGTVGTIISGGSPTFVLGNAHALGSGDVTISGGSSTFNFAAPMTLANNIQLGAGRTLTVNDGGNAITLSGAVAGSGTMTYNGSNSLTLSNIGVLNTINVNGSVNGNVNGAHLVLSSGTGTLTNNTCVSNAVFEVASGSTIAFVNSASTANALADNGGTFTIDAGATLNCIGATALAAANTANSTNPGTINVNGTLVDNSATFLVARNGTGILNLNSGGLIQFTTVAKQFDFAQNAASATLNMNGGTLLVGAIGNGNPTTTNSVWNWNGGTLKATNTTASGFFNRYNYLNVYIRNGGGVIDNNGINITNRQPFLHSTNVLDNITDGGMTFKGSAKTTWQGTTNVWVTNTYTGPTIIAGGTLELTNTVLNPLTTISISNGAVLQLDGNTLGTNGVLVGLTNQIAGLTLGGVSQPNGVYSSANVPTYITGAGALQVGSAGPIAPTNSPTITQISLSGVGPSGGNVIINGTNGEIGATYYLLMSTNLAKPLNQWKTVATNVGSGNTFSFTETNAVTAGSGQQFYLLSSTNFNP